MRVRQRASTFTNLEMKSAVRTGFASPRITSALLTLHERPRVCHLLDEPRRNESVQPRRVVVNDTL